MEAEDLNAFKTRPVTDPRLANATRFQTPNNRHKASRALAVDDEPSEALKERLGGFAMRVLKAFLQQFMVRGYRSQISYF